MTDGPLTADVVMAVPATLWLRPEWGAERPATAADLKTMGFQHHRAAYDRFRVLCDAMGIENPEAHPRWNLLRYFIEYVTMYEHVMDPDDLERFRGMIEGFDRPTPSEEVTW